MKIQNIIAEAVCGKSINLTTIDQFVLGQSMEIINNTLARRKAYVEYENIPWRERDAKDEDGNYIIPRVECVRLDNESEFLTALNKVVIFCNKLAIKPGESNIFEESAE